MLFKIIRKIFVLPLFLLPLSVAAEVYECHQAANVSFQNKPCVAATVGEAKKIRNQDVKIISDFSKVQLESYDLNFSECKKHVLKMQFSANRQGFKTLVLQNDATHYSAKVCASDRAVLMACDGMKRKMFLRRRQACS